MAALDLPDLPDLDGLGGRLDAVRRQIALACGRVGRPEESVTLLAVSKLQPPELVAAALLHGQRDFGENYAQELRDKAQALAGAKGADGLRWHFIGPLQRNKARLVVGRASLIHTVDSVPLAEALAAQVRKTAGPCQDCLVQVNVGAEPQKAGCTEAELPGLLSAFAAAGGALRCLGLMCIPPQDPDPDPERSRPYFRRLRELLSEHSQAIGQARQHVELRELSMGMSHDFAVAIEEGATLVRVGTAIFGPRPAAGRSALR